MKRILVIRFSSMGDVLLAAPVLKGCIKSNPEISLNFLSKCQFTPYLSVIEGLKTIGIDTKQEYKGILGLLRLSRKIRKESNPDIIIDLHNVLRSRFLGLLFALHGKKVYRIDKGRTEKKAYLKGNIRTELKHTVNRYKEVFDRAGIQTTIENFPFSHGSKKIISKRGSEILNVGVAPFARHQTKTWPLSNMVELLDLLNRKCKIKFHFYGGPADAKELENYDFGKLNVEIHSGIMSPDEEMISIAGLDFFISMDSANMHLADLLGIPVFSIWGATHPDLGFRALNQPPEHSMQTQEELPCRPCSVFGNKPCTLKDNKHKCLISISPSDLASKILSSIS